MSAAGVLPGMNVFEPGCGTGRLTELMSHQIGPEGGVVALDMSRAMLEVSRNRLKGTENVSLLMDTMENTNLVPDYFDAVICHNVFHHFSNKIAMLRKTAEILKPQGQFLIHHFLELSEINNPARKVNDIVYQDLMPPLEQMQSMFSLSGMKMIYYSDSNDGFIVRAALA
jgi:demethylmenaquinone methyltransferase/2-methoxy-6-polyprenyl-1,4-benzoquinol methylase